MDLTPLAGNAALKKLLGSSGGRGLSHAYIISGPVGSGRKTLAVRLAQALLCGGRGEALRGLPPLSEGGRRDPS